MVLIFALQAISRRLSNLQNTFICDVSVPYGRGWGATVLIFTFSIFNSEIKVRIMSLKSGFWEKKVWRVKTVAQSSFLVLDLHGKCKYISIIALYHAFAFAWWSSGTVTLQINCTFRSISLFILTSVWRLRHTLHQLWSCFEHQCFFQSPGSVDRKSTSGWWLVFNKLQRKTYVYIWVFPTIIRPGRSTQSHYGHHVSQINVTSTWRASKQKLNKFLSSSFVCVVDDML